MSETSIRERGCWSTNAAVGYKGALEHCLSHLKEAVLYLEAGQVDNAEKYMRSAQICMDEANVWFNQANNQMFRINALVDEVKKLRNGETVQYAEGRDPVDEKWRWKSEPAL